MAVPPGHAAGKGQRRDYLAWGVVGALVLLVVLGVIAAAGGAGTGSGGSGSPGDQSPAAKLAALEEGGSPSGGDPLVAQMQSGIDTLTAECGDSASQIEDEDVATYNDLESHGIQDETYLSLLQHVGAAIPGKGKIRNCGQIFAAYAVIREKG